MGRKESLLIRFLYCTIPGRLLLKWLVRPEFSQRMAYLLSSGLSRPLIGHYIRKYRILMEGYEDVQYHSFNEFFTRRRLPEAMYIDRDPNHLISPCDGLLSAYPIDGHSHFTVKHSDYTLFDLLGDRLLANQYQDGICLIFRLTPRHYHRYCYIDDGKKGDNYPIPGVLHSVRPLCCGRYPVYVQNCREYTLMDTLHFGQVIQIEVGALLVGRIWNEQGRGRITRGGEKGHFEYGGSTILLLLQKDAAVLDGEIFRRTIRGQEYPVRMGQRIGRRPSRTAKTGEKRT